MKNKIKALAQHLDCKKKEIVQSSYNENLFEYGSEEYLVVTDEEADELWDEYLENYIDDCILPDLNEIYHTYFDREAWKNDASYDGRAHSLNRYDGSEDYVTIYWGETMDGVKYRINEIYINSKGVEELLSERETYYIYRQN